MMKPGFRKLLPLLVLLVVALALPFAMLSNQYNLILLTTVILYATLASAWNIIGGMAGQFDLAAGAYLGLGAFTSGTLLIRWNITPWVGMIAGGLIAAAFALLVGYPLFRFKVREVWYALSSAALVLVLRVVFMMWEEVGGPTERYIPFHDWSLYHLRFRSYIPYYYLILIILVITLWLNHRIRNRKLGYYLLALGDNEEAAEILGVDARGSKLKALMIYAFIAGVLGGGYACLYGFIHPNFFSSTISLEVAILGVVGGVGITYGPLLAALILVSGREFLRANVGGQLESLYLAIYAIVLILIALFRPQGIGSLLQKAWEKLTTRTAEE
jgi:branched-chain amino acid transport system permease protein